MFMQIRENCELNEIESMDQKWQLDVLIGHGLKNEKGTKIRKLVVNYMKKPNELEIVASQNLA